MAKKPIGIEFKNVEIDLDNMKIIETLKEGFAIYDIMERLEEFRGVKGLSISIKGTSEVEPDVDEL